MKIIGYLFVGLVFYYSSMKVITIDSSNISNSILNDSIIINLNDSIKLNNFHFFGIVNHQTKEMLQFKAKYGVGFQIQNCVVNPFSYKMATFMNKKTVVFLNDKFGDSWLKELPISLLGVNK
jgi:hypothetical protein